MLESMISYCGQLLSPPTALFQSELLEMEMFLWPQMTPLGPGGRGLSAAARPGLLPGFTKPQWMTETLFTLFK